jgi:4-amino-4-deoxy-L-arabinose transferase-like glycosyltransferase
MKLLPHRMEFLLMVGIVLIHFVWFTWPLILPASDNERLVSTFNVDEGRHVRILKYAVSLNIPALEDEFEKYVHSYGNFYFIAALIPCWLINIITPITEQQIIVVLRLVSVLFGILTVLLVFLLAQRYFGRFTAWLSTFLLMFVPLEFLRQSTVSHPDITQLFFLVLGIFFCCLLIETSERKWLLWASASGGFAMATKYSGLFLLPLVWLIVIVQTFSNPHEKNTERDRFLLYLRLTIAFLGIMGILAGIVITPEFFDKYLIVGERTIIETPYLQVLRTARVAAIVAGSVLILISLMNILWSAIERNARILNALKGVTISILVFALVFSVFSPFSLIRLNLLKGLYKQTIYTEYGVGIIPEGSGFVWLRILASHHFLSISIFIMAAINLIVVCYAVIKNKEKKALTTTNLLWIWIIFYLSFLVLRVNRYELRYILPVVPFLIIFGAQTVSMWMEYAMTQKSKRLLLPSSVIVLLTIGGFQLSKSLDYMLKYRYRISHQVQQSGAVKAGNWLLENYPAFARILYDHYSYIPPVFKEVRPTFGGTIELLRDLNHDLVVVSKEIANRYLENVQYANRYAKGEAVFKRRYNYYIALREGTVNYSLVRDFDDIRIYERN